MIDFAIDHFTWPFPIMDAEEQNDIKRKSSKSVKSLPQSDGKRSSPILEDDDSDRGKRKKDFPWKLHLMLEDAAREGNEHIVSWNPDGLSFQVHKTDAFLEKIMPRYFNQTQFRSFQRMVRTLYYIYQSLRYLPNHR